MLLAEFINKGTQALEPLYPAAEARNLVLMLCEQFLGTKSYTHIVDPRHEVDPKKEAPLQAALQRLLSGEPVQYVLGKAVFCGREFLVSPSVLIPRPETELMAREAVKIAKMVRQRRIPYGKSADPVRVLDLCTGSGNIAWTIALEVPGAHVVGVDLSESALEVAAGQPFELVGGAAAPQFVKADVLDTEQAFDHGQFDLIVSNPPYVMDSERSRMRPNVLEHEPSLALFVPDGDPLLYYRAIARWSQRFFAPEGKGLTEINELLGSETEAVFLGAGFSETSLVKDVFDKDRFVFYR